MKGLTYELFIFVESPSKVPIRTSTSIKKSQSKQCQNFVSGAQCHENFVTLEKLICYHKSFWADLSWSTAPLGSSVQPITETTFTRCRHILKTVKNSTDRPPVHTKTAHFFPADFENGRF